jgi:hypothetical protein
MMTVLDLISIGMAALSAVAMVVALGALIFGSASSEESLIYRS